MYSGGLGGGAVLSGAIVLPNTGSNRVMAIVAGISIVVGAAILLSSTARLIAKKAYKA